MLIHERDMLDDHMAWADWQSILTTNNQPLINRSAFTSCEFVIN